MKIKIAINGFGRIGRQVFKRILEKFPDLEVVAIINDLTGTSTLAHLFKYDSNYGVFPGDVGFDEKYISVNGKEYAIFSEKDPLQLPWKKLKVDIVLECTGFFTKYEEAKQHIEAGAKKVIISAPSEKDVPGFILGVNEDLYDPKKVDVMDMGSCTTNCLATMVKVLNDNFGIEKGFMTTIHSYTNDQKILDLPHKDLRRARAAAINIIPTTTGAAKSIGKMIPELNGKLDGIAIRVPTPVVSILDLIVNVKNPPAGGSKEVNEVFKKAEKEMKGVLRTEVNELVSMDFKGDSSSAIVDLPQTMAQGNLIKVVGWYDNEWGYSCRLADFTQFVAERL